MRAVAAASLCAGAMGAKLIWQQSETTAIYTSASISKCVLCQTVHRLPSRTHRFLHYRR